MHRFPDIMSCGFASGVARYDDHYPGHAEHARIVIVIGTISFPSIQAVVDTGAPWCVLDPELIDLDALPDEDTEPVKLIVRGELYEGQLTRMQITLPAQEGEDLKIETTVFVPILAQGLSWPHPNFIGTGNFLSRICFAIDPHPDANAFYFGAMS